MDRERVHIERITGILVALIGSIAILGWWTSHTTLALWIPGIAGMTFNTALGFVLTGSALLLPSARQQISATPLLLGGFIAGMAALSLLQTLFAFDLGLDNLFFSQQTAYAGIPYPGRMSPITSMVFLMSGTVVLLLQGGTAVHRAVILILLLLMGVFSANSLVMNALYASPPIGLAHFASMSAFTAVTFLLVTLGQWYLYCRSYGLLCTYRRVFSPAMELIQGLSLSGKFLLIALLFILPLGLTLYQISGDVKREQHKIDKELSGRDFIQGVAQLVVAAQQQRGMHNASLLGSRSFEQQLAKKEVEIDRLMASMDVLNAKYATTFQSNHKWLEIRQSWLQIRAATASVTPAANWAVRTQWIAKLISLMMYIGVRSEIMVDTHTDTHYLMSAFLDDLPDALEVVAQARGIGAGVLAAGMISDENRFRLSSLSGQIRELDRRVKLNFTRVLDINQNPTFLITLRGLLQQQHVLLQRFLQLLDNKIIKSRSIDGSTIDYFGAGTRVIRKGMELFSLTSEQFSLTMATRKDNLSSKKYLLQMVVIIALTLAGYLLIAFYLAVKRTIAQLQRTTQHMLAGDMHATSIVESTDELGQVVRSFNEIAKALVTSGANLKAIINFAVDGLVTIDEAGLIQSFNPAAEKIFGYPANEVLGKNIKLLMPASYHARHDAGMARYTTTGDAHILGQGVEVEGRRKDGSHFPLDLAINTMRVGDRVQFLGIIRDITTRKQMEMEKDRLAAAVEQASNAIIIANTQGVIVFVNAAFERLNGCSRQEAVGKNLEPFIADGTADELYAQIWQTVRLGKVWKEELVNLRKDGSSYEAENTIASIQNAQGDIINYVCIQQNISIRKQAEKELAWLSYYDGLTKLANRRLFIDRVGQALALAKRNNSTLSLLFLDLDRFKFINDTLGHSAGDEVLIEAGQRIKKVLRASDTAARMGGDEFTVLLPDTDPHTAMQVAQKIRTGLQQPYPLGEMEFTLDASIGIAAFPQDGTDHETLLKHADAAMYQAKHDHEHIHYFSSGLEKQARDNLYMEQELSRAVDNNQLILYYQSQHTHRSKPLPSAQAGLDHGIITGVESLIRWIHPTMGMVSPADFIPLAEETGLIASITYWVLEEASRQAVIWEMQGTRPDRISINVSAVQLMQKNLAGKIIQCIQHAGAKPEWMEIEITESAAMRDPETAIAIMQELVDAGFSVAIDDFGTGYSSLAYLKRLPAEWLKIDIAFIRDLPEDQEDAAIVRATIGIAHALGMKVIAEGVETEAQLAFLADAQCDTIQGYLFSKPLPPKEAGIHLQQHQL